MLLNNKLILKGVMTVKEIIKLRISLVLGVSILICYISSCESEEKDDSLTIDEYVNMGLPDPNRPWESDDFLHAYNVLTKFKWPSPKQLPKKGSEKSGEIFKRMISLENLTFLKEDTLKLNEKALLLMNYLQVYENWRYIYTDVRSKDQYHHRELVDIQLFGLSIIHLMLDYADRIQKSDDPVDIAISSGDHSIREMYIRFLAVTIEEQLKLTPYVAQDMQRVADTINQSINKHLVWMNDDSKAKIKDGLSKVIENTSNIYVKELYIDLSEAL